MSCNRGAGLGSRRLDVRLVAWTSCWPRISQDGLALGSSVFSWFHGSLRPQKPEAYQGRGKEEGEWGWGTYEKLDQTLRPAKTQDIVSRRQNNTVKEVGTPPVRINLRASLIAVSTAVLSKVTKTVSEKQLFKAEAKDSPTHRESPPFS